MTGLTENKAESIASTFSAKIRGLEDSRMSRPQEFTPLAQTHIIFNRFVEHVCKEMLAVKNGEDSNLKALLEVTFKMPASAGNHLLTRLLQTHGKDNSDLKQINNVRSYAEKLSDNAFASELKPALKEIEKLVKTNPNLKEKLVAEISKDENWQQLSQDQIQEKIKKLDPNLSDQDQTDISKAAHTKLSNASKAAQEQIDESRETISNCDKALALMAERNNGVAPWKDLGIDLKDNSGADQFCKLGRLPESWQRQIFQASIESLKSHFNLKTFVAEERQAWEQAHEKVLQTPEVQDYLTKRDAIIELLNGSNIKQLNPKEFIEFFKKLQDKLYATDLSKKIEINPTLVERAEKFDQIPDNIKAKRAGAFRRDLLEGATEIKELLNTHIDYEKSFARVPGEPTLTIPDPFTHPKHVIWGQQQWREIELGDDKWIKIKLPLLKVTSDGIQEEKTWFTIRGDKRFEGIKKEQRIVHDDDGDQHTVSYFSQKDAVTGKVAEVKFGAVRLVPKDTSETKLLGAGSFDLKIRLNREIPPLPQWVSAYKKKEIDPNTNEPKLPDKIIVVSFVTDLSGKATIKAADVAVASYGKRKLNFLPKITINDRQIASDQKIMGFRDRAERIRDFKRTIEVKLDLLPISNQNRKERRKLVTALKRCERRERKQWDKVINHGDERANRFAGHVVREIEKLRKQFPTHEVAFVLDYRADRKPDNNKWSKQFNRKLMGTSTGQLLDKVAQSCQRVDPQIPVFNVPTYGFSSRAARATNPNVLHFMIEEKNGAKTLKQVPFSQQCAVVTTKADGKIAVSLKDSSEIIADNMLASLVAPSKYSGQVNPKEAKKQLGDLFEKAKLEILKALNIK